MSDGMDPRQWADDDTVERQRERERASRAARNRIEDETRKFGQKEDSISHEEAAARETARALIPEVVRKTAEQLNAEHAAKDAAAASITQQMFDDVPWDLLRNHIKARGFILIPTETDDERKKETMLLKRKVDHYQYAVAEHVDKALSVVQAARILLGDYDADLFSPEAVDALLSAMESSLQRAKSETL
jgi:Fe-S cluster assembly scaffold protein SufB